MNIKGILRLYKTVNGVVEFIHQPNAITYAARNTLIDVLDDGSKPIKYMVLLNIDSSKAGDRSFFPSASEFIDLFDSSDAVFDLSVASVIINSKTVTTAATKNYSTDDGTVPDYATLDYVVNIPCSVIKTGETFNCVAIFDSTADPGSSLSSARLFSFAVLTTPVTVGAAENLVINYGYIIR